MQDQNTKISENFGQRLRMYRIQRSLGQSELGKFVDRSASTISDWEKSRSQPSLGEIEKLAEALEVSCGRLAFGSQPESLRVAEAAATYSALSPAARRLDELRAECRRRLETTLAAAGDSEQRLGWLAEHLTITLRPPDHWGVGVGADTPISISLPPDPDLASMQAMGRATAAHDAAKGHRSARAKSG